MYKIKKRTYYNYLHPTSFDADLVLKQVKRQLKCESDISSDTYDIKHMIFQMLPRKQELLYTQINEKNLARHLASFIPNESFSDLLEKADLGDTDAQVAVADCYYYGLKQQFVNCSKGSEYYAAAVNGYHPEALTWLLLTDYNYLLQPFNENPEIPLDYQDSIPEDKIHLLNEDDLRKIFESLDKLAILDWISPAFVGIVQQFKRLKIWKSKVCELAMERRNAGEKLLVCESFIKKFKNLILGFACLCSKKKCFRSIMEQDLQHICRHCVKRGYCSLSCQQTDWSSHQNDCIKNPKHFEKDADHFELINEFKKNYTNTQYRKYLDDYGLKINYLGNYFMSKKECIELGIKMNERYEELMEEIEDGRRIHRGDEMKNTLLLSRLKNLPNDMTLEILLNKGNKAFQKKHYNNAAKDFSYCIDKIMIEITNKDTKIKESNRLAKLYAKRADCNFNLAQIQQNERLADKAISDCVYVLETGFFDKSLIESDIDLCNNLKKIYKKAIQLKMNISNSGRRENRNASETANQRRRRLQREREQAKEEKEEPVEENHVLDANLCSELGQYEKKLAINASHLGDECPMCYNGWADFAEFRVAAILPCNHAVCAQCLLNFYESCTDSAIEENERCSFGCPLCRLKLTKIVFYDIASAFVKRNLVESFEFLSKKLPFDQDYFENLIVSLLYKTHKFDLSKVESALFNMIGLIDQSPDNDLSSIEKQKFYEVSREPVRKLQAEVADIKSKLWFIDTESEEGIKMKSNLNQINRKLQLAIQNASRDIFERVNSKLKNNVTPNGVEIVCCDLHGLHVNEAKLIANEYIIPILEVSEQIMIITGRGVHSQNGKSVLKEEMKMYFTGLKVRCEDVLRNEGAFYVFGRGKK